MSEPKSLNELLTKEEMIDSPIRFFLKCDLEKYVTMDGQDFICNNKESCYHKNTLITKSFCSYMDKKMGYDYDA